MALPGDQTTRDSPGPQSLPKVFKPIDVHPTSLALPLSLNPNKVSCLCTPFPTHLVLAHVALCGVGALTSWKPRGADYLFNGSISQPADLTCE